MKADPDMLERGEGIVAIAGSLSHSHLNCSMRNIIGGKKTEEKKEESSKMPEYEERPSTAKFFAESSIPTINEEKLADRSAVV